jgi:hypothetical protein
MNSSIPAAMIASRRPAARAARFEADFGDAAFGDGGAVLAAPRAMAGRSALAFGIWCSRFLMR